jgi:DNA end-binding protein Ku
VLDLIERKASGEEIAAQPEMEEPAAAPDLMAALEASLAAMHEDEPEKPKRRAAAKNGSDGVGAKRGEGRQSRAKAKP